MKVRVKKHWFATVHVDKEGLKITENVALFTATRAQLVSMCEEDAFGMLFDEIDGDGAMDKIVQAVPDGYVCTYGAISRDALINIIRRDVQNKTLADGKLVLAYCLE